MSGRKGDGSPRFVRGSHYIISLTIGLLATTTSAEVVLDGSLGQSGAVTGPDFAITQGMGQTRGNNLFHSFSDFNLNSSESATFSGAANINNIISRVTGGNASNIDGTISSTINGADFYFINPNGVVFGENATLNVSGSFYATTADYVTLGSDGRFDASQPGNSVLTVSTPSAFGFVDASIAPITVNRSQLAVAEGETLALIGGDIHLSGIEAVFGNDGGTLRAASGRTELISLASVGEVDMTDDPDVSSFQNLGNISMDRGTYINTRGDPGGTIYIRGGNLVIESSSLTSATTGDVDHAGIGIDIAVRGDLEMRIVQTGYDATTEIVSSSFGTGRAGDVRIRADRLIMRGENNVSDTRPAGAYTAIASRAFGSGDGGDITVDVHEVSLGTNSQIDTHSLGGGHAGDISLNSNSLEIVGIEGPSSRISSSTFSPGNAGSLNINANNISIQGGTNNFVGISSQASSASGANATSGDINITTDQLTVRDGAQINADVFSGSGDAGDINVNANSIEISGINNRGFSAGLFSTTSGFNTRGNAGDINVTTNDLTLSQGGRIDNSAYSWGAAGNIDIVANNVQIYGAGIAGTSSGLFSISGWVATRGGNIDVAADRLELVDGGLISTQTVGIGNGGNINLDVDRLLVTGVDSVNELASEITASTVVFLYPNYALGDGGSININARDAEVSDQGRISTASSSAGDGGTTTIDADTIMVSDKGIITATSTSTGQAGNLSLNTTDSLTIDHASIETSAAQSDGGDITIRATQLLYLNEGSITTSVQSSTGNGGNIDIDPVFVVLNHSNITADAQGGNGGNITIVAANYLASPDSNLSASSSLGVAGTVVVNAPNNDISAELEAVPEPAPDATKHFRNDCVAVGSGFSSFVAAEVGPPASGSRVYIPSNYIPIDRVNATEAVQHRKKIKQTGKPALILAKQGVDCLARL